MVRKLKLLVLVLIVGAVAFVAGRSSVGVPAAPHLVADLDAPAALWNVRRTIDLEAVPLQTIVVRLEQEYGEPIAVDWGKIRFTAVEPPAKLSLHVKNASLAEAIGCITSALDTSVSAEPLSYKLHGQRIVLTTADDASRNAILRTYDIGRLLTYLTESGVIEFAEGDALRTWQVAGHTFGGKRRTEPVTREEAAEQIMSCLRESVAVGSWKEDGGQVGTLRVFMSDLLVWHQPHTHREVVDVLDRMQAAMDRHVRTRDEWIAAVRSRPATVPASTLPLEHAPQR